MQNFQDTFETRQRSFINAFFNLHDCTFKRLYVSKLNTDVNQMELIEVFGLSGTAYKFICLEK